MTTAQKDAREYTGLALFERGFRPFFLGAGLFAGLVMPIWVLVLIFDYSVPSNFLPRDWHLHEMVFGFIPAVLAGFLLTAIPKLDWSPASAGQAIGSFVVPVDCRAYCRFIFTVFTNGSGNRLTVLFWWFLPFWFGERYCLGRNYRNAPVCLLGNWFCNCQYCLPLYEYY